MPYEVTIGIPVYNVEKYIRQTLDSALAQSFNSIEFLICDDCGTDSSIEIVKEYQFNHPRGKDIRIVKQHENMGVGCARNLIIEEALSEYIFFMDSDDLIVEDAIDSLYKYAKKYDADIVYGSMEKILVYDNNKRFKNIDYPLLSFVREDEFAQYAYRKYDSIQASSCNYLIKLDVYRNNNLRYLPINYWEDMAMSIDLPIYISRAVLLPDVTYYYICRSGSLSNYQKREHIEKDEVLQTIQAITMIKDHSDIFLHKPYFSSRMLKVMMTCFYVCCTVLRNRDKISPEFESRELRDFMRYPISFGHVFTFNYHCWTHIILYIIGILPPSLSVALIRLIGKVKHLI